MGNKLKEIFSDAPIDMGGNIRFENADAYKKFLEALDIAVSSTHRVGTFSKA